MMTRERYEQILAWVLFAAVVSILLLLAHAGHAAEPREYDVRVICPDHTGSFNGSGTIVASDEQNSFVLTAQHVIRERPLGTIVVETRDHRRHGAQLLDEHATLDLAMLAIGVPNIFPISVASELSDYDWYWVSGFPFRGYQGHRIGKAFGAYQCGVVRFDGAALQGMSGGRITNPDGKLVGVISTGSFPWQEDEVAGPCGADVYNFCEKSLRPYVQCWNGSCQQTYPSGVVVRRAQPKPTTKPKPDPAPDRVQETCDCEGELAALENQCESLQAQISALEEVAQNLRVAVKQPGPKGAKGERGPKGEAGEPAEIDLDALAEKISGELTHSARLYLEDGTVKTQTKPLSEPLDFIRSDVQRK